MNQDNRYPGLQTNDFAIKNVFLPYPWASPPSPHPPPSICNTYRIPVDKTSQTAKIAETNGALKLMSGLDSQPSSPAFIEAPNTSSLVKAKEVTLKEVMIEDNTDPRGLRAGNATIDLANPLRFGL